MTATPTEPPAEQSDELNTILQKLQSRTISCARTYMDENKSKLKEQDEIDYHFSEAKAAIAALIAAQTAESERHGLTEVSMNGDLRDQVHMKMLTKSENAKDVGDLTVIPIGFAVTIALELIKSRERAARIDGIHALLLKTGHSALTRHTLHERIEALQQPSGEVE